MTSRVARFMACVCLACGMWRAAPGAEPPAPPPSGVADLAAPLDPLAADRARAEAEVATAKALFTRGDLASALRGYQRAWRWDPTLADALAQSALLSASAGRVDQACRYALLLTGDDRKRIDETTYRRLAFYASQRQDWEQAARLYRRSLAPLTSGDGQAPGDEQAALNRTLTLFEIGRLEYLSDQPRRAAGAFGEVAAALTSRDQPRVARRAAAALGGDLDAVWETIGACFLEAGRHAEAAEAFSKLAENPRQAPRADLWLARVELAMGRPAAARERLWRAIDGDIDGGATDASDAVELLESIDLRLNDQAGLSADLERLARARPRDPYVALARAEVVAEAEGPLAGLRRIERLLRGALRPPQLPSDLVPGAPDEGPVDDGALAEMGERLIELAQRADQANAVLPALALLAERFPTLAPVGSALRRALEDKGFRRAMLARVGVVDAGADLTLRSAAARVALEAGEPRRAVALWRGAAAGDGEDASADAPLTEPMSIAIELLVDEHWAAAAEWLALGLERGAFGEDEPTARFYLATALAATDQHDAALEAARAAAAADPTSAEFACRVAWVLNRAGRVDQAIEVYREVVADFDDDPAPATREALKECRLNLSYLTLTQGDPEQAAEWAEQVLDEFPQDPGAMNDLGYLWADRGENLLRARRMIEGAVAAEPDNGAYHDSLGWVLHRLGDDHGALRAVRRAVELESAAGRQADGEILDHLGDVLASLGRSGEAADAWRQSAERYEADKEPDKGAAVRKKLTAHAPAAEGAGG